MISFKKIFGILSPKKETKETKEIKRFDLYLDKYKKSKSELDKIESNYDNLILKSLESDFDLFKESVDKEKDPLEIQDGRKFWNIDKDDLSSITLSKKGDKSSAVGYFRNEVRLIVSYSFNKSNFNLEVTGVTLTPTYKTLDKIKLKKIIEDYIMCYKLGEINKELIESEDNYKTIVSIIGKGISRDSKIDEILNNLK